MRQAAVIGLGGRDDAEGFDTGDLRGHDVHDNAARIDSAPPGNIETDARDRQPTLGDSAARDHGGRGVRAHLIGVHQASPADRLLQRGAHGGIESLNGGSDLLGRHPQMSGPNPVEALGPIEYRLGTPSLHIAHDGEHRRSGFLDVHGGAGQHRAGVG